MAKILRRLFLKGSAFAFIAVALPRQLFQGVLAVMSDLEARPAAGQDVLVIAPTGTTLATPVVSADHTTVRVANVAIPTPTPTPTPTPVPTTTYTFSDDFTGDLSKWTLATEWPDTGLSKESDNDPAQVSIVNGQLRLRCERGTTPTGRAWRSAVIDTKGKFSQLYGNFQACIWYPKGQGLWPAFWLLANGSGPRPELDIMEAYPFGSLVYPFPRGGGPTQYAMSNHWRKADGTMTGLTTWCRPYIGDLTLGFHIFELEWRAGLLIARLDGKELGRQTANVPAEPMFVIFDHVVGSWAGLSDATTPSPADMLVDWVRVTA